MAEALFCEGVIYGLYNWDTHLQRIVFNVLQAAVASRGGDLLQQGFNFEHLVMTITLNYQKGHNRPRSKLYCPVALFLAYALRRKAFSSQFVEDILLEARGTLNSTIQYNSTVQSQWVFTAFSSASSLNLEKPADIQQVNNNLAKGAAAAGFRAKPTSHASRYGAASELQQLDSPKIKVASDSVAAALGVSQKLLQHNKQFQGNTLSIPLRQRPQENHVVPKKHNPQQNNYHHNYHKNSLSQKSYLKQEHHSYSIKERPPPAQEPASREARLTNEESSSTFLPVPELSTITIILPTSIITQAQQSREVKKITKEAKERAQAEARLAASEKNERAARERKETEAREKVRKAHEVLTAIRAEKERAARARDERLAREGDERAMRDQRVMAAHEEACKNKIQKGFYTSANASR
ncbi:hypothetical protein IFR05_009517 [Cadophora sp. M221]|nr:hypothetical protein IFR05_009517 [Cadophora sp. M221]